ncbi:hypothetical protein [Pseudophaeobacter sp.]|uniref:hypothetical protein n=1 Tax=Pseudophaeobacter sp. TaxID=1971739 RepID=UPI002637DBA2|nr:hypothetical protein [Pseudophaeobacter sp.]
MPIVWPLPTSEFLDLLPIKSLSSRPGRAISSSEAGDGSVIFHQRGARLWQGQITLDMDAHDFWASVDATLSILEEPGASFLFQDPRMTGPITDPQKAVLGSANPVIAALSGDAHDLSLSGLPAGYELQRGDLLGFSYGVNPTRLAYHRIYTGGIANLAGDLSGLVVVPKIRSGAQIGAPVTLGDPVLKATLKQADYGASRSKISDGGSFEWVQTLR